MNRFDEEIDRRQTNSYKWEVAANELPMWVADMDFAAAPVIQEALAERLAKGVFGYEIVPDSLAESYCDWWQTQHQTRLEKDWLMFCTGVVPAISSIVRKLTRPGDNVVVLSPVYNIFYNSIVNNFRKISASELLYEAGRYQIDWPDLEARLQDVNTNLMIFCNPHNPIGKIWEPETLARVGELCVRYGVTILSDEIHCDLTFPQKNYTPFLSLGGAVAQQVVMCASPSKAFNMAGLQTSAIIIQNDRLRQLVERGINTDEVAEPNAFAVTAAVAALTKGAPWLAELKEYLFANHQLLKQTLEQKIPELSLVASEATYLAWIDCRNLTTDTEGFCRFLQAETGLIISSGQIFGTSGAAFIRLNFATTRKRLADGLARLEAGVTAFKKAEASS